MTNRPPRGDLMFQNGSLRHDAFVGKKMLHLEKGFPQLEVLELNSLFQLMVLRLRDKAMPKLIKVEIKACGSKGYYSTRV